MHVISLIKNGKGNKKLRANIIVDYKQVELLRHEVEKIGGREREEHAASLQLISTRTKNYIREIRDHILMVKN